MAHMHQACRKYYLIGGHITNKGNLTYISYEMILHKHQYLILVRLGRILHTESTLFFIRRLIVPVVVAVVVAAEEKPVGKRRWRRSRRREETGRSFCQIPVNRWKITLNFQYIYCHEGYRKIQEYRWIKRTLISKRPPLVHLVKKCQAS